MKRYFFIILALVLLAGCASSGRDLLMQREQNGEDLYRWAWYNIVDKDFYRAEFMRVVELDGREVFIKVHYCGPEKMLKLSPCKAKWAANMKHTSVARLPQPCIAGLGTAKNEVYVLAGHLSNGRLIVLGLEAELNKRYEKIEMVKVGL